MLLAIALAVRIAPLCARLRNEWMGFAFGVSLGGLHMGMTRASGTWSRAAPKACADRVGLFNLVSGVALLMPVPGGLLWTNSARRRRFRRRSVHAIAMPRSLGRSARPRNRDDNLTARARRARRLRSSCIARPLLDDAALSTGWARCRSWTILARTFLPDGHRTAAADITLSVRAAKTRSRSRAITALSEPRLQPLAAVSSAGSSRAAEIVSGPTCNACLPSAATVHCVAPKHNLKIECHQFRIGPLNAPAADP